jgi:hypothetical protein
MVEHGEQDGVFGGEPVHRLPLVGQLLLDDSGPGLREGDAVAGRVQQPVGGVRGVQVVVEHAMGGGVELRVGVVATGEVGRVGVQQVVQGVPVRRVLSEEVRLGQLGQLGQQMFDAVGRDGGEARGGGRRDVGAGVVAQ